MAGYAAVKEEQRAATVSTHWVRPQDLIDSKQEFCILDWSQDHEDREGRPQITFLLLYVKHGVLCERQFDVSASGWRLDLLNKMNERVHGGRKGFPYHHLRLVRKALKGGHSFLDFEDVPGIDEGVPCACDGAGVIDPDDASTWTEHYRMTMAVNTELERQGFAPMDTGDMSEDDLRKQMALMRVGKISTES